MRLVFLNIDGVINQGYDKVRGAPSGFDYAVPSCVVALNGLTRATGASIIVSSAWRDVHPLAELRTLLKGFGVEAEVVDNTPNDLDDASGFPAARIAEIRVFLDLQPPGSVESFVVLDDLDIRLDIDNEAVKDEEIEARTVRTVTEVGLTDEDAVRAARLLVRPLTRAA